MWLLLLILQEVFGNAAEESATDCSQEAMASLFAEEAAAEAAANGTEETTIALGHRRSVWIVVRGIGVRGLARKLVVLNLGWQAGTLALSAVSTLTHLVLISLVLAIGVGAAVLLRLAIIT